MKVPKVVARFSKAPRDPSELRRVARSLGSELPRQRVETLREFRAAMTRTPVAERTDGTSQMAVDRTSYAVGYLDSMMDVTAEYESIMTAGENRVELSADVARGIQIAVQLFQHMSTSPFASDTALTAIAGGVLGDTMLAAQAVEMWSHESHAAGLITEPYAAAADTGRIPTAVPVAVGSAQHLIPEELLWANESAARDEVVASRSSRPSLMRAITEPLPEVSSDGRPSERELLSS